MGSHEVAVEASLVVVGMRVLSCDQSLLGAVEKVGDSDFTLVDSKTGASARVSYELVEAIDDAVHLMIGPSELDAESSAS
jgi:hypothetical protein